MLRALFTDRYRIRSCQVYFGWVTIPCLAYTFARLLLNSKQSLHTFKPPPITNQIIKRLMPFMVPPKPQCARVALPRSVEKRRRSTRWPVTQHILRAHVTCRSASCHAMTQYSDVGIRSMKHFRWNGIMRYTCPNLLLMIYYIGQKPQSTPCLRLGELPGHINWTCT